MKQIIFILLVPVIISCKEDDMTDVANCDSEAQLMDRIEAMKQSLDNCRCEISVMEGIYNNSQTVFFTALTDPLCNGVIIPTLYDCEGNVVKSYTEDTYPIFEEEVKESAALYRCKE